MRKAQDTQCRTAAELTRRDRVLKVWEFSERVGMSVPWARKKIAARELAVVRIGRSVRIPESEVTRILSEGMIPAREGR